MTRKISNMTRQKYETKFLKIFYTMLPLVEDMSKIYAHPLPRVNAIFLFAIEYSAKARPPQLLCAEEVEPWLNTQWQTDQ